MPLVGTLLLILVVAVPEAEGPLPDRIGPTAPITGAGIGGVVASIIFIVASTPKRESAIKWGVLVGFVFGAVLYLLALFVQIGSGQ